MPKVTLLNIHRLEGDGHGWCVNVVRRQQAHARYFADREDGPFASLRAAIDWRDETWRTVGPARHARPKVTDRCATGVVGVSREVYETTSGNMAQRYRAMWNDETDRARRSSFSISKYGEEAAKRMAIEARRQGVAAAERMRQDRLLDQLHAHRVALTNTGAAPDKRRKPK